MAVLRHLAERPWLTPRRAGEAAPEMAAEVPIARFGVWVFLAVVTMLFALLIVAYAGRMALEDWRPGPQIGLLWLNTAVLLASSAAMHWAVRAARRGDPVGARFGLFAAGLLGALFLAGQCLAWLQLTGLGEFPMTIPSVAFFYLITGLHALHIAGGLAAWGVTLSRVETGALSARSIQMIELCALYWHFLLGIWLMLFGLIFSGNNLSAVMAFCGLR